MKEETSQAVQSHMGNVIQSNISHIGTNSNKFYRIIRHRYFIPLLYIIAGIALLISLFGIFDTYVLRVKVESAVVTAPIETMVAPMSGYISDVYVHQKQNVKKGDPLMKIVNISLERDMQLAKVQVEEARLNVSYYQNLLNNEQQKLQIYQSIGSNRVESAQSKLNISKQDMITAQHNLKRMKTLHDKQYLSDAAWENEVAKAKSAEEKYKTAKAQQAIEHDSLNAVDKGMFFTGNKLEGVGRDLNAELETAQKKVELSEERYRIYQQLVDKLTLKAPYDGTVTQILKSAGNTTDNAKPVIFIEQLRTNKNVVAYLTQSEVAHIGDPQKVKIYIPSSGKVYPAKINHIDRTDGFVDMVKAQYRWRDFDIDRSAMVTVDIQNKKEFDKEAFAGMPAIVYFSRRLM